MPPKTIKAKPLANGTKAKPLATNRPRLRCFLRVVSTTDQGGGKRRLATVIRCNVESCGGALRVGELIAAEGRHRNKELASGC